MKPSTYCKNCGAYIPDGKKKCLACGFPVDVPSLYYDPNKVETTSFQETMPDRSVFKPFENYTHDLRYFCNGYEINENGRVLSIPDDDEIPIFEERNRKPKEPKPDIDLDDLMEKTFVTVKINDRVSRFYLGDRIQVCIADGRKFGCTFDGRVIGEGTKKKIDVCLVEA